MGRRVAKEADPALEESLTIVIIAAWYPIDLLRPGSPFGDLVHVVHTRALLTKFIKGLIRRSESAIFLPS